MTAIEVGPVAIDRSTRTMRDQFVAGDIGVRNDYRTCTLQSYDFRRHLHERLAFFFIDRSIFAGALSALMVLAGLLSMLVLQICDYPEFAPPTIVARAHYPGVNRKVIAETVTTPLRIVLVAPTISSKALNRFGCTERPVGGRNFRT